MSKSVKPATKQSASSAPEGRWRSILIWGAGTVVLILFLTFMVSDLASPPEGGVPEGTEEITVTDRLHVEGEIYDHDDVPAGGDHSSLWANCGFYSEPIEAENALHSLEHGAVWITYQPSLPQDQIDTLRPMGSPTEKVLVSPVEGQPQPIMATAWGFQLELEDADDPRLAQFVTEFAGSLSAPEPGGSCRGGVGNPG